MTRFFERDSPHGIEDDVVRFNALYRDTICHQYILLAIEHYATTLKLEMKHVYQALPRLLSLWFDFVSVQPPSSKDTALPGALKPEYLGKCDDCIWQFADFNSLTYVFCCFIRLSC